MKSIDPSIEHWQEHQSSNMPLPQILSHPVPNDLTVVVLDLRRYNDIWLPAWGDPFTHRGLVDFLRYAANIKDLTIVNCPMSIRNARVLNHAAFSLRRFATDMPCCTDSMCMFLDTQEEMTELEFLPHAKFTYGSSGSDIPVSSSFLQAVTTLRCPDVFLKFLKNLRSRNINMPGIVNLRVDLSQNAGKVQSALGAIRVFKNSLTSISLRLPKEQLVNVDTAQRIVQMFADQSGGGQDAIWDKVTFLELRGTYYTKVSYTLRIIIRKG